MAKKMLKKALSDLSNEQLALNGIDFFNKKAAIKELDAQCKEIRVPLEQAVMNTGKTTESGSKILVLPYADKEVHIKETLRVGKVLLPEAIDVLKKHGFKECVENVPTVREDVIERLYEQGTLPLDVLKQVYAEKPSFAFSVEVKNKFNEESVD